MKPPGKTTENPKGEKAEKRRFEEKKAHDFRRALLFTI